MISALYLLKLCHRLQRQRNACMANTRGAPNCKIKADIADAANGIESIISGVLGFASIFCNLLGGGLGGAAPGATPLPTSLLRGYRAFL